MHIRVYIRVYRRVCVKPCANVPVDMLRWGMWLRQGQLAELETELTEHRDLLTKAKQAPRTHMPAAPYSVRRPLSKAAAVSVTCRALYILTAAAYIY